jgi:ferredoxin--NADP+ reductase
MGQTIEVTWRVIGDVALFGLDRSLTGQDGRSFSEPPDDEAEAASVLARRLFESDDAIDNVHVLSNTVTVRRPGAWDEGILDASSEIIANLFIHYGIESPGERVDRLRAEHYNATITSIRAHNPDLWIMRVRPDEPVGTFEAGQYTTLGLGYWEERADHASEDFDAEPEKVEKMALRSYSISSSIVGDGGGLVPGDFEEVEFYIVQVPPGKEEIPALTPRIFLKEVGDRIYMSTKFTGRYTLEGVKPTDNVVFLATGTGEAPQNAMTAQLLRNGHQGHIATVVCVRYRRDLAYTAQHDMVEERFPNYRYMSLTTREPDNAGEKAYIQDMITSGRLEKRLGAPLDPADTHVFLCGNPKMIGPPRYDDDGNMTFPETLGVCQLLHERGFTIDHRRDRGNVHYEEYWREKDAPEDA